MPFLIASLALGAWRREWAGRIPVECVVRGYLAGSGWKEYRESGTVCGIALPPGLMPSSKLPEPIFTPATKDNLIAWMAGRSDGEHYGHLVVYRFPKQELIFGPRAAA
jgi:phosphoribosylaminoimidazole-succinocarboxamide synthase